MLGAFVRADQRAALIDYLIDVKWAFARRTTSITQFVGNGNNHRQLLIDAMHKMSSRASKVPIHIFEKGPSQLPLKQFWAEYESYKFALEGFLVELTDYEAGCEQHLANAHAYINAADDHRDTRWATMVVKTSKVVTLPHIPYSPERVEAGLKYWDTRSPRVFNFPNEFVPEDPTRREGNIYRIIHEILTKDRTLCVDAQSMMVQSRKKSQIVPHWKKD